MANKTIENRPEKSPVFFGVTSLAFLSGPGVLVADSLGRFLLDSTFNKKRKVSDIELIICSAHKDIPTYLLWSPILFITILVIILR